MRQINDPQFVSAEFRRNPPWLATIAHGLTLDDVLDPAYWSNIANKLHMLDHIECWWEDGTRYVELLVVNASAREGTCRVLNDLDLSKAAKPSIIGKELENYDIGYAGPDVGFRVVRKADNVTLHSDPTWTADDAQRWLMQHLSQPNRRATAPVKPLPPPKAQSAPPPKKQPPPRPPGAPIPGKDADKP